MGFLKSLAGPGYVILNTIRAMNIIALLSVVVASSVMLVKTFVVSKFFFFDAVSHIITACLGMSLILTELPIAPGYVSRNWPLLGPSSGFVTLGVLMVIVGVSILGNLNKEATSEQSLGLSFWQIVISSGIIVLILGVINIVASYVFRTKSLNVTARMVRCYGAVAPQKAADIIPQYNQPSQQASSARSPHQTQQTPRRSFRRSFHLTRSDTLPSYYTSPQPSVAEVRHTNTVSTRAGRGLEISNPMSADQEQFAKFKGSEEIRRPDSAMHPARHPAFGGGRF